MNVLSIIDPISDQVNNNTTPEEKKLKGQYFTSSSIAKYMAELLVLNKNEIRVLDPGAGTGVLIAALVDRIISEKIKTISLKVDLYENDKLVIPYLEQMMEYCLNSMEANGYYFEYNIYQEDFITDHAYLFESSLLYRTSEESTLYDLIISNPPYYKVKKNHEYSRILADYVHGQPNVYFMFMAVAAELLNDDSQLVFITPRSYTSGAYFERFRERFFDKVDPDHIHVFNSRKGNFKGESVLQENIILSGFKRKRMVPYITVSSSGSSIDEDIKQEVFDKSLVLDSSDQINLMRLPLDKEQAAIIKMFDNWSNNLTVMGMNISTGPVVTFRNKELIVGYSENHTSPLLYMKHLKNLEVKFPVTASEQGVKNVPESQKLLVPSKNYVLVKRFTSKEQKKRVDVAAYLSNRYPFEYVGLENHLNYIYKVDGQLSEEEVYGIVGYLNSKCVDQYFRIVNGNTQVNASDIRPLPFPDYQVIVNIGKGILSNNLTLEEVDHFLLNESNKKGMDHEMVTKEEQAIDFLKQVGMPPKQQNKRSALTLLALLGLKEEDEWSEASSNVLRIVDIMEFMKVCYDQHYAANSRESIRRQTIHQFEQAQLIVRNPDDPTRPTNSGNTNYAVTKELLEIARTYGTSEWTQKLEWFQGEYETLVQRYESKRKLNRVPVKVDSTLTLELSPGEHNTLQKEIVENFAEYFAPGSQLLYLGDTENKYLFIDKKKLSELNFPEIAHDKLPDVVLYQEEKNWLFLIEAVTSHGPISDKRKYELEKMLERSDVGNVFVTAFPSMSTFKQYADDIAWDTEVWFSDNPKHMMHLNGDRFLGPR
ncbi:BsuBI/PstI family type II restriction endonuclease [Alkalihalobacterium sp. APHAB7]|uniref:BsuBI/PstI family type II restriction endonuclease n=1 Tax=Alkalihalobacterium sp. APHAB7 TaxID=3402081 RepID=UPI003AAEB32C